MQNLYIVKLKWNDDKLTHDTILTDLSSAIDYYRGTLNTISNLYLFTNEYKMEIYKYETTDGSGKMFVEDDLICSFKCKLQSVSHDKKFIEEYIDKESDQFDLIKETHKSVTENIKLVFADYSKLVNEKLSEYLENPRL